MQYLGSNKQLSDWTQDLTNKRKIMRGTGNLAKCQRLVKSWILEKKLQLTFTELA